MLCCIFVHLYNINCKRIKKSNDEMALWERSQNCISILWVAKCSLRTRSGKFSVLAYLWTNARWVSDDYLGSNRTRSLWDAAGSTSGYPLIFLSTWRTIQGQVLNTDTTILMQKKGGSRSCKMQEYPLPSLWGLVIMHMLKRNCKIALLLMEDICCIVTLCLVHKVLHIRAAEPQWETSLL